MQFINPFLPTFTLSLFLMCVNSNRPPINMDDPDHSAASALLFSPVDTSMEYIMGKFDPERRPEFIEIDTMHADRPGLFLREDAYTAFIAMFDRAKKDGIKLVIRSATRNFNYQKGIWERKWTGETQLEEGISATGIEDRVARALTILKYSSMPGTSRHHWGTDIDLNAFNNSYFSSGEGLKLYSWMQENAVNYGFCQPYTKKGDGRDSGYEEEKWHWSFYPVSRILTEQARKYLDESMIKGFLGSETAIQIKVVEKYVLGIDPNCF